MTDKEKILAEIKRKQEEEYICDSWEEQVGYSGALDALEDFINSLPKEPASENLEEESYHAAMRMLNNHDLILPSTTNAQLCTAYQNFYKEAANWQKGQMMKDAVNAIVCKNISNELRVNSVAIPDNHPSGIKFGDDVKIIIIKEAEK